MEKSEKKEAEWFGKDLDLEGMGRGMHLPADPSVHLVLAPKGPSPFRRKLISQTTTESSAGKLVAICRVAPALCSGTVRRMEDRGCRLKDGDGSWR